MSTVMGAATAMASEKDLPKAPDTSAKLKKSAQEFEAILLANWLENMTKSFVGSTDSQDAAHDTVSSLGTQAIASALAARGGIGIAAMMLRQLQPADAATARTKLPQMEKAATRNPGQEQD